MSNATDTTGFTRMGDVRATAWTAADEQALADAKTTAERLDCAIGSYVLLPDDPSSDMKMGTKALLEARAQFWAEVRDLEARKDAHATGARRDTKRADPCTKDWTQSRRGDVHASMEAGSNGVVWMCFVLVVGIMVILEVASVVYALMAYYKESDTVEKDMSLSDAMTKAATAATVLLQVGALWQFRAGFRKHIIKDIKR